MDNSEFDRIFETIAKSKAMIPSDALLSILAGIVNSSGKESEGVRRFAEALKDCDAPDLVSKAVMFTCNSVIINLWKAFGPQFEEAYRRESEKASAAEGSPKRAA